MMSKSVTSPKKKRAKAGMSRKRSCKIKTMKRRKRKRRMCKCPETLKVIVFDVEKHLLLFSIRSIADKIKDIFYRDEVKQSVTEGQATELS